MSFRQKAAKRSPLKRKPLHNPGESLQQEIDRLLDDKILSYVLGGFLMLLLAFLEWVRWFRPYPPQPIPMTIFALLFGGYCTFGVIRYRRQIRALRLGMEGEKAVGQFLEELRSHGCRVFHDIVGDGFNLDHVVVSPRGIFVIETKTYSKPMRGQAVVEFDGERLLVNGLEPDRNPVRQALAARAWLREILAETTGRQFPVKAVIVLPGWFVEPPKSGKRDNIWVLNPKALPAFIENEPIALKTEDVALVGSRIIGYMTR